MTLLELSKQILFAEIKKHNEFWTLKRKVEFRIKHKPKKK